jgi:hypothetical protein
METFDKDAHDDTTYASSAIKKDNGEQTEESICAERTENRGIKC